MNSIIKESDIHINDEVGALYFYSTWLPYHKKMIIMISKMEEKYNLDFKSIDVDNFPSLCKRFSVNQVPTVLVFNYGKEIKRIEGLVLTSAFKSAFADICNNGTIKICGEKHGKES